MMVISHSKFPFRPLPLRPAYPAKRSNRTPVILISLASYFLILFLLSFFHKSSTSIQFSIVIDAGSSGTRIHVFAFTVSGQDLPSLDLDRTAVMRSSPGLSSFVNEPGKAGDSIVELLGFAKQKVGKDSVSSTEIRLMATAGLRMLDEEVKDEILESCRKVLRDSGFKFQDDWAIVIPGSDEGIYAWVAANYARGTLGGDPKETTGIIELGGASAQIAFVSDEMVPAELSHVLNFGKTTYNIYSNSFLHFGQNAAQESLHELLRSGGLKSSKSSAESTNEGLYIDPCTPKGYDYNHNKFENLEQKKQTLTAQASGNFAECRSAALELLQKGKDECENQRCTVASAIVPELHGKFLATENFFYTSKFFGLDRVSSLSEFLLAGEKFCGDDWSDIKEKYNIINDNNNNNNNNLRHEDVSTYCFSSAYIIALLHDSLGISLDDKRIEFANQIGEIRVEWALGAFITHTVRNMKAPEGSVVILARLLVPALPVLGICIAVLKWRKPKTKLIYDMEMGCYVVVTRVD